MEYEYLFNALPYCTGAYCSPSFCPAAFWQEDGLPLLANKKKYIMAKGTKRTVLSALENIIKAAKHEDDDRFDRVFFSYDDSLMEKVKKDSKFLAGQFEITPKQAVLFAIVLEMSKGDEFTKSDLARALKTNFINLLSYEEDLKALEKGYLIRRCRWGKIQVGEEVQKSLERNKAYQKPTYENLSTNAILTRIGRIFHELDSPVDHGQDAPMMALLSIDDMILANPTTSIAKVADKYKILRRGDKLFDFYDRDDDDKWECDDYMESMCPAERLLFYGMCYRYLTYQDDYCAWFDFRYCFGEKASEFLQDAYKDEELSLQEHEIMVYANRDGLLVKDHFKIEDSVKEEIWADCGGLPEQAPMAGTLRTGELKEKHLFYDDALGKEVGTLSNLLSEERYGGIKTALEEKGMRSGFTCLFYGDPGTGKTETVYQLARATGRDIIMADVSKLKSMWVGESEKNLKSLFSRYRRLVRESKVTPILLFNEADAIFGIRQSGAESAVDKMENSLQNIILQEMEDLKGIMIATTNLSENFDKAFERRFLYKVKFDKPTAKVKAQIWKSMMPELSDADAQYLSSKFELSGGQIENIVRKKTIQSILQGKEPAIEEILRFCCEEERGARSVHRRSGF